MSERIIICIGTKKGLFVAEGAKNRRKFELRGPFGSGVAVYSFFHGLTRLDGYRQLEIARLVLRDDDRTTLDRARRRRRMELPVRLPPTHQLRENRRGLTLHRPSEYCHSGGFEHLVDQYPIDGGLSIKKSRGARVV